MSRPVFGATGAPKAMSKSGALVAGADFKFLRWPLSGAAIMPPNDVNGRKAVLVNDKSRDMNPYAAPAWWADKDSNLGPS